MGEITPRTIIIGLVVMVFAMTAVIFLSKEAYIGASITNPAELTALEANFSGLNTDVDKLATSVNSSTQAGYEADSSEGWVSASCTSLLGDDNFFCAGIKTLNSVKDAPQTMKKTVDFIGSNIPKVEIPTWVTATVSTILTVTIIFVIISSLRRYKS